MSIPRRILTQNVFLGIIALGVVIICLQNFGIIPTNNTVRINGGFVSVSGDVGVSGDVDVSGTVSIDNTVDVNLEKIIGHNPGCRKSYTIDGEKYVSLDVSVK